MIYTSYFARANKLSDVYRISVCYSTPSWATVEDRLPVFAPTWEILDRYKKTGNIVEYEQSYFKLLDSRKDQVKLALQQLQELSKDKTVLLCCWENADKLCHRHLLAKYLGTDWKEYMEEPGIFDSI